MLKKVQNKTPKKSNMLKNIAITFSVLFVVIISYVVLKNIPGPQTTGGTGDTLSEKDDTSVTKDSDLVIKVSDISDKAKFYPVEIAGTKLEVIAVKAPDGSIRTAFNTCQVCYSSGRGYYIQEGDVLVCQNCGNRFKMDQVEVTKGGCNPVPISSAEKTTDDTNITISKAYLTQAKSIFANWKS